VITVGTGIGSAVGAWGAGWIFDVSGSYRLAVPGLDRLVPGRLRALLGPAPAAEAQVV
jgi:hypothetical protein